jgi:hypothetical protein
MEETYISNLRLQNSSSASRNLRVEPWGDEVSIPAGVTFDIVAQGPPGDCLEIESGDDDLVVYGWPGSTIAVFHSGQLVLEYRIPVPPTPSLDK